jgi:hypothetical protein
MKGIHPLFVLTIFISRRTENLLGNPKEGLLEPKFLGLFLRTYTNEVVCSPSIVFHAPKEMHEEFHKVHIKSGFVSIMPRVKSTKSTWV